jgi:hypothetical protein
MNANRLIEQRILEGRYFEEKMDRKIKGQKDDLHALRSTMISG